MAFQLGDNVLQVSTFSGNTAAVFASGSVTSGWACWTSGNFSNGDFLPYTLTDGSGLLKEDGFALWSGTGFTRNATWSVSGNTNLTFPDNSKKFVALTIRSVDFQNVA